MPSGSDWLEGRGPDEDGGEVNGTFTNNQAMSNPAMSFSQYGQSNNPCEEPKTSSHGRE